MFNTLQLELYTMCATQLVQYKTQRRELVPRRSNTQKCWAQLLQQFHPQRAIHIIVYTVYSIHYTVYTVLYERQHN